MQLTGGHALDYRRLDMKWPRTKQTANAGVLFVQSVVNSHGSIFHPVHQESDVGIDGFIELVNVGEASGKLVAVQIKSGDSYLAFDGGGFRVPVDRPHLDYWLAYMVPVILVCFSPSRNVAAWTSIRDFVEGWNYRGRGEISAIDVPEYLMFTPDEIGRGIATLARSRSDERILFRCADKCFSRDPQERRDGFDILQAHPDSRRLRITASLARRFLLDDDPEIARKALFMLGYGVGRSRWSWNPNNREEKDVIAFTGELCSTLTVPEIERAIALCDDSPFNGPSGLGERCADVLCCCFDTASPVLDRIVRDTAIPMARRTNALLMLHYGSFDELIDVSEFIMEDDELRVVMIAIFGSEDEIKRMKQSLFPRLLP